MSATDMLSVDLTDGGFFILSATVLYCYDYVITFGEELRCVWKRCISGASVLFVLNRYMMMTTSLINIIQVLPWSKQLDMDVGTVYYGHDGLCNLPTRVADIFLIVSNISYALFAAMRMFALYDLSKPVFGIVFGMGLINPCIQILIMGVSVVFRQENPGRIGIFSPYGRINCISSTAFNAPGIFGGDAGTYNIEYFIAALQTHALIFEVVLIVLTWRKMDTRLNFRRSTFPAPFAAIMFQNGTLYFLIIALVSVLNIIGMVTIVILPKISNPSPELVYFAAHLGSICPITDAISSICMSRFIIDLFALTLNDPEHQMRSSQWKSVRFATVVEATVADISADLNHSFVDGVEGEGDQGANKEVVEAYETTLAEVTVESEV